MKNELLQLDQNCLENERSIGLAIQGSHLKRQKIKEVDFGIIKNSQNNQQINKDFRQERNAIFHIEKNALLEEQENDKLKEKSELIEQDITEVQRQLDIERDAMSSMTSSISQLSKLKSQVTIKNNYLLDTLKKTEEIFN